MKNKNVIIIIMNILIVVLSVVLLVVFAGMIEAMYDVNSIPYKERSFEYTIQGDDYHGIVDRYYQNKMHGYGDKKELQEYYGVAKYYEAATYYHAYITVNDSERAAIQKERMDAAFKQMGEWDFVAERIQSALLQF